MYPGGAKGALPSPTQTYTLYARSLHKLLGLIKVPVAHSRAC